MGETALHMLVAVLCVITLPVLLTVVTSEPKRWRMFGWYSGVGISGFLGVDSLVQSGLLGKVSFMGMVVVWIGVASTLIPATAFTISLVVILPLVGLLVTGYEYSFTNPRMGVYVRTRTFWRVQFWGGTAMLLLLFWQMWRVFRQAWPGQV